MLSNTKNEIINNNIQPVDRRTGDQFSTNDLIPMTYDNVVMKSIMQEVSISFDHSQGDKSMFAIPPYKVRQLESLIKERVIARYNTPLEEQAPVRQNASYQAARYLIYISDFDLGISSGPVRDL